MTEGGQEAVRADDAVVARDCGYRPGAKGAAVVAPTARGAGTALSVTPLSLYMKIQRVAP